MIDYYITDWPVLLGDHWEVERKVEDSSLDQTNTQ